MYLAFWQIPFYSPVGDSAEGIYQESFAEAKGAEACQREA